ncbi:MAG: cyclase family protein [Chloroflexi bacterium]|nr:cyclase family protein [Chloroflexota bacterium]
MCSPLVEKVVRERIHQQGLPHVSRRNFLKLGGLTAGGLAVASLFPQRQARAQDMAMPAVVDLSHVFGTNIPTYTPGEAPTREDFVTVEANGFFIQRWSLYEHAGTHVDFPAHFIADGETVDNYPVENLLSPAVVIDISERAASDPDAMLTADDIQAWESANGDIPPGAVVCMYSAWEARWNSVDDFRNPDGDGVMHFPGFAPDAAAYLIEQRDIHGIAVDTLSLDPGNSTTFDVHYAILGAGKFGIENIANLAAIKDMPALVFVGIPRWEGSGGGPSRIVAFSM